MSCVDGFLLSVPLQNVAAYRRLARKVGKVWLEHGALEFRECMAAMMVDGVMPFDTTRMAFGGFKAVVDLHG